MIQEQLEYERVLSRYGVNRVDYDIEPPSINYEKVFDLRSRAIAAMQADYANRGDHLSVQFTVPVEVWGVDEQVLKLLISAISNGVEITTINLMTMDFGGNVDPNNMAANPQQALAATLAQVKPLFRGKTDAQLRAMLGATVIIGRNDSTAQVFTLTKDAPALVNAAYAQGWNLLSLWQIARDSACPNGNPTTQQNNCSGVNQTPYAFSAIFSRFFSQH